MSAESDDRAEGGLVPEPGFPPSVPVVVAGSAPWDTPAPVNAHQVARRLAERGHRVLYVESTGLRPPSIGARHDRSRMLARVARVRETARQLGPTLWACAPLALPGSRNPWLRRASLRALAWQAARAVRQLGFERPVVWSFLPTAVEIPDQVAARLVVYHCVDDYAANPGVDPDWIGLLESRMLERADLVIATSPVLAERLAAWRSDVLSMPNVADVGLFETAVTGSLAEPAWLRAIPHPRLVWVGNLAGYRIDEQLLEAALEAEPAAQLVLVGAVGLGDLGDEAERFGFLARERVHRIDAVAHEALPAVLAHCDVALIPFLDNAHTRGSLPLKLWEYLAAGLPVVARDLPNFAEVADAGLVFTAADPAGFGAAVQRALRERPDRRAWRSAAAQAHGWPERIEMLCAAVGARLSE